jgi:hypothetical protein
MKRLTLITAASLLAAAYTSTALASETAAETATESADPSVSGMLPADEETSARVADPASDTSGEADTAASANQRSAKNAIYLDLGGPGAVYSINYDRMITDDLSARIGFSYMSFGASAGDASASVSIMSIPLTVSYLGIGSLSNMLEVGGGGAILRIAGDSFISGDDAASASASVTALSLSPLAGYRHQAPDGGFVFRVGVSPIIVLGGGTLPWGYMSFGAGF